LYSSVLGGGCNSVSSYSSAVLSGGCNTACGGGYSVVAGGRSNKSCSAYGQGNYGFVGGGYNNINASNCGVIGGGDSNNNRYFSGMTIAGGTSNCAEACGTFIGGGQAQCNAACFGTIVGGCANTIFSAFSGVLGGSGNCTPFGQNYVGIFGCNIDNQCSCSFAANRLWACNLVGTTVAVCVGTDGLLVRGASDCRLKTNICNLKYGLCDVKKLNPISFDWNDKERQTRGCNRQIGFIAQEVEPIIPEAVGNQIIDGEIGEFSLSPDKIIPVLTKALQELSDKFDAQAQRIEILEDIIKRNNLV
jgi:hypothetical protein